MPHAASTQQQAVLDWAVNDTGSLNLVARAGTGKTSTLLMLVEQIGAHNLGSVFLGAYNRAIADELIARIAKQGSGQFADANTMHSIGSRAWNAACTKRPKLDSSKTWKILDALCDAGDLSTTDHERFGSFVVQAVSLAKQSSVGMACPVEHDETWREIIDHHGLDRNITRKVGDGDDDDFEAVLDTAILLAIDVFKRSLAQCRKIIDFDDMLWAPLYFGAPLKQYDWVLIDEAQDTNAVRRLLAHAMLRPGTGRLVAVGDDKQAIYGFTGADSDAMQLIKRQHGSKELPLNVTYRCGKNIVRRAQAIVPDIEAWDQSPEGEVSTVNVDDWNLLGLSDADVVLCRNNAPLVKLAYQCIRARKPCRIEGRDIAANLEKMARRWKTNSLLVFDGRLREWAKKATARAAAKDNNARVAAIADELETLLVLIEATKDQHGRDATVDHLCALIRCMFGDTDRRGQGKPPQVLTFSSIHKSKGKEWERVHIYGANLLQPSAYARKDWECVQEENLMYVAATRAERSLVYVDIEQLS